MSNVYTFTPQKSSFTPANNNDKLLVHSNDLVKSPNRTRIIIELVFGVFTLTIMLTCFYFVLAL